MADKIQDFFNMHPDDQSQMGAQLMQSGQVSANDVAQAHSLLQTPEGQDWLGQYLKPKGKIDPYTLNPVREPASDPAASPKPLVKAPGKKVSTKSYQPTAPDKISDAAEGYRNLPEVADQQKSLKDQEDQLNMQMAQPVSNSNAWIKPLLALTDSQTGSHLMEGYTPPETMAQRNARLMKMQDEVQKRKGDLAKELLGAIGKDKGTTTNIITGDGLGYGGARKYATDWNVHKTAIKAIADDPTVKPILQTYQNLDNAVKVFNQGKMPTEFHELQQAVRSNMGIKGSGGVNERADTYVKSLGLKGSDIQQFLTGDPVDVLKQNPKMVKAVIGLAQLEMENKSQQAADQISKKAKGFKNSFYSDPERAPMYEDFKDTLKGAYGQFGRDEEGNIPAKKQAPAAAPDFSKMKPDEVKAWIKANGG